MRLLLSLISCNQVTITSNKVKKLDLIYIKDLAYPVIDILDNVYNVT